LVERHLIIEGEPLQISTNLSTLSSSLPALPSIKSPHYPLSHTSLVQGSPRRTEFPQEKCSVLHDMSSEKVSGPLPALSSNRQASRIVKISMSDPINTMGREKAEPPSVREDEERVCANNSGGGPPNGEKRKVSLTREQHSGHDATLRRIFSHNPSVMYCGTHRWPRGRDTLTRHYCHVIIPFM